MLSGAYGGNCELCDITAVNIYSQQTYRHSEEYRLWDVLLADVGMKSIIFHMWIWYFLRAIRSSKLPLCIVQWGRNLKFLENPFKILQGRDICRFYLFGQMIAYLHKDRDVGAKPIINLIVDLSRIFKYTFWLAAAIRLFHWNKRLNKNNTNNWLDLCF